MNLPFFPRMAAVLAIAVTVAGCAKTEGYHYKLTLAVNTPDGIKRASSVGEVVFWNVSIPARGTMHKLRGNALYLDLGPGARPLVALLTHRRHVGRDDVVRWSIEAGPDPRLLMQLYGEKPSDDYMDDVPRIAAKRGPRKLAPDKLPDLVTFADVNDPGSVIEVDPNDLQATLGSGISWNEITIEIVDEPNTKGIEQKLPWIPYYYCTMLDGHHYRDNRTLANSLSTADFDQSGEAGGMIRQKQAKDTKFQCWDLPKEWQQRSR